MKKIYFTILMLFSSLTLAQNVPQLTGPVVDLTRSIDSAILESKIRSLYNNGEGPQVNILVMDYLQPGYTIEQVSYKVASTWKLGDLKRNDGVLFLLATKSRKVRIEVGKGLEGVLTDAHVKRILSSIRPELSGGRFNEGLMKGLNSIIEALSQKPQVNYYKNIPMTVKEHFPQDKIKEVKKEESFDVVNAVWYSFLAFVGFYLYFIIMKDLFESLENYSKEFINLKKREMKFDNELKVIKENVGSVEDGILENNKKEQQLKKEINKNKELLEEESLKMEKSPVGRMEKLKFILKNDKQTLATKQMEKEYNQYLVDNYQKISSEYKIEINKLGGNL